MTSLVLLLLSVAPDAAVADAGVPVAVLPELRRLAKQLEPTITSPWVKQWLRNTDGLKSVTPKTWYCSKEHRQCFFAPPAFPGAEPRVADDEFVYSRISDPLGYARAFEIAAAAGFQPSGKRVLDFGYGNLGQLLMLAALGADVHGLEVDPLLVAGTRALVGKRGKGSVTLHDGYFASDERVVKEVGGGYDLWISKNTLKRGYVHPAEPPGAKAQLDLGLDDAKLLALIHSQLNKGGLFFIYNIGGAPQQPYKPMTDIRCPYSKEALIAAGFEVLAFEQDDTEPCKAMARSLEWAKDWPAVDSELHASYTLLRRR